MHAVKHRFERRQGITPFTLLLASQVQLNVALNCRKRGKINAASPDIPVQCRRVGRARTGDVFFARPVCHLTNSKRTRSFRSREAAFLLQGVPVLNLSCFRSQRSRSVTIRELALLKVRRVSHPSKVTVSFGSTYPFLWAQR